MRAASRIDRWLRLANWARFRGNDRVANYCIRRAKRVLMDAQIKAMA
jgi:hypothetical protein